MEIPEAYYLKLVIGTSESLGLTLVEGQAEAMAEECHKAAKLELRRLLKIEYNKKREKVLGSI